MEFVEIIGYSVGFLVGLVMGLIGGGGSLLLPVFIYLFKKDVELSTAYTLILVGLTACVGLFLRRGRKEVDWGVAITLAIPVLIGTLVARSLIYWIPDTFFYIGDFEVTKRLFIFTLFSTILVLSFASIVGLIGRNLNPNPRMKEESPRKYYSVLVGSGLFIGVLSGLVGAGGGVMIVPLLIVIFGLPVKTVVGTSLAIMAFKSTLGFAGDLVQNASSIEFGFVGGFAVVMFVGILVGSAFSRRVPAEMLKLGFGWFILAMAIFFLVKEFAFPDLNVK